MPKRILMLQIFEYTDFLSDVVDLWTTITCKVISTCESNLNIPKVVR